MSVTYGPTETITAVSLREGDWIERIPAQSGQRGVRVESAIQSMEDVMDAWTVGRGAMRRHVDGLVIRTRRGTVNVPVDFQVTVRRAQ